jgi:hypothetical protein
MLDVRNALRLLALERPLFHSEADLQHALAWKIHEIEPRAKVRLEVPSKRLDRRERIDILVTLAGTTCAIELKYKKRGLQCTLNDEIYSLANDGAQDIGRYDFIKDIARLERYVASTTNAIGWAILITNDELYWKTSPRGISSAAFFLHEGRVIDNSIPLTWHRSTGEGTMRGRTEGLQLRGSYKFLWDNFSSIANPASCAFRCLAVKIVVA